MAARRTGLRAARKIEDRLRDLFGADYPKNLRAVDTRTGEVTVRGFVSLPAVSRSDRNEQYIFVNGRPTGAALLNYAVSEGYRAILPRDRHPSVFLFLETDPGLVDVNVHPTKKEVRFRHGNEVRDVVIAAIREALASSGADVSIPAGIKSAETERTQAISVMQGRLQIDNLPATRAFKYPRLPTVPGGASAAPAMSPEKGRCRRIQTGCASGGICAMVVVPGVGAGGESLRGAGDRRRACADGSACGA